MSEKHAFCLNRWNMLDVLIFFAVLVSIFDTCAHKNDLHHHAGNIFGTTMVAIRYSVQVIRILLLIKASR
jgi:hypothetical protein